LDSLYRSKQSVTSQLAAIAPAEAKRALSRITYIGESLSFAEMARLYDLADCYVSPYYAEGFNMPVLEAAACGLPVICTAGGATDDFTTPDFALRIDSKPARVPSGANNERLARAPSAPHLLEHMLHVIESADFRERAREAGPAFVRDHYTW